MYDEIPKPYYTQKDMDECFNTGFWFGMFMGACGAFVLGLFVLYGIPYYFY